MSRLSYSGASRTEAPQPSCDDDQWSVEGASDVANNGPFLVWGLSAALFGLRHPFLQLFVGLFT